MVHLRKFLCDQLILHSKKGSAVHPIYGILMIFKVFYIIYFILYFIYTLKPFIYFLEKISKQQGGGAYYLSKVGVYIYI